MYVCKAFGLGQGGRYNTLVLFALRNKVLQELHLIIHLNLQEGERHYMKLELVIWSFLNIFNNH